MFLWSHPTSDSKLNQSFGKKLGLECFNDGSCHYLYKIRVNFGTKLLKGFRYSKRQNGTFTNFRLVSLNLKIKQKITNKSLVSHPTYHPLVKKCTIRMSSSKLPYYSRIVLKGCVKQPLIKQFFKNLMTASPNRRLN